MTYNNMNILEDTKVNIKLKISALWITMLFIFAYVDIFWFFQPGIIEGILAGQVDGRQINQVFLVFTTVFILIPSFMVFLSLVLKPAINRWTNIIVAMIYAISTLYLAISEASETWVFYTFSNIIEVILLLLIVWYAWKWPKQETSNL